MKRLAAIALAATLAGCCSVERKAVENIEATHNIVLPQYVAYVEKDAALKPEEKDDRKKLVDSLKRLVEALKKSME